MQLVEQHVIDKHDPRHAVIDEAAFKSKNLYNAALFEILGFFLEYTSGPITAESTEEREERQSHVVILPEPTNTAGIAL
jgi:hypothetical protein